VAAIVAALASAAALVLVAFTLRGSDGASGATGATGKARPIFTAIARAFATQCLTEADPTTLCLNGEGFAKPTGGSISLSRVHGMGNLDQYYYLNVMGDVGHQMRVIMEVRVHVLLLLQALMCANSGADESGHSTGL
jgi:hypothetical protein